jgi:hypothetical protein
MQLAKAIIIGSIIIGGSVLTHLGYTRCAQSGLIGA